MPRIELDPSLIGGGGGNAFATAYQNALANSFKNQAEQQNIDINQYKMDAAKQEQQQSNALAQLLGGQGFDPKTPQSQAQMYSAGGVKNTQGYLKSAADIGFKQAETDKQTADARKSSLEGHFKRFELMGQLMGGVNSQESYDQMRAQAANIPELADLAPKMPPQYDPEAIKRGYAQAMSQKDRLAAEHQQITREETGRHNLATEKNSVDNNVLNNKTSRDNNFDNNARMASDAAAGRGVTMRGQNMTDARSRESNSAAQSQFGKAPAGYRFTPDGNMQAIPGGPADLKISAEGVKKTSEAKDVLSLLDEVDTLLPKSTGSYVGAGIDALAGGVGYGTKGAESTAQLKALEGALISKMPKMSGPQSDKDVLLYKQMAGQVGDSTKPVSQRQAASGMIRKLNEKYAGVAEGSSKKGGGFDDAGKESRYQAWKAGQGK